MPEPTLGDPNAAERARGTRPAAPAQAWTPGRALELTLYRVCAQKHHLHLGLGVKDEVEKMVFTVYEDKDFLLLCFKGLDGDDDGYLTATCRAGRR